MISLFPLEINVSSPQAPAPSSGSAPLIHFGAFSRAEQELLFSEQTCDIPLLSCKPQIFKPNDPNAKEKEKRKVYKIQVAWSSVAGTGTQSLVLCSELFCLGFRRCIYFQVGDLVLELWVVCKVNFMLFVQQLKSKRIRRAVKAEGGCWLWSGGSGDVQALRGRVGGATAMNM